MESGWLETINYDGHIWEIGQFENGSWGFQQDDICPIRYMSKYEAELIYTLLRTHGTRV